MHPNLVHFGRLEVVEVYTYYEKPLLFSCHSPLGTYYLAVLIEEAESAEHWLYVEMSLARFQHVRSGGIDLHCAFSSPETGVTYEAIIPNDERVLASIVPRQPIEISADSLPAAGEFLSLPTDTLPRLKESVVEESSRRMRDVLRLHLKLPEYLRSEAPAKLLGEFLKSVQDTINSLAQALRGQPTRRGTFPRDLLEENEMAVLAFGGGSFAVTVAPLAAANLFGDSEASDALEGLITLFKVSGQAEELQERLRNHPRVAANYLALLRSVEKRVDSVRVEWATPRGRHVEANMPSIVVKAAIAVIESESAEDYNENWVIGRLVGAHLEKKSFDLAPVEGGASIEGRIADAVLEAVDGAVIGQHYRALIGRTTKLKPATGEVHEETELLALEAAP